MTKPIFIILTVFLATFQLNAQTLKGTKWQLIKFENLQPGETYLADPSCKATLHFDTDTTYRSYSGCNTCWGPLKLNSDRTIAMDNPYITEIGCSDPCKTFEKLFSIYPYATHYNLKADTLTIFADSYFVTFKKQ